VEELLREFYAGPFIKLVWDLMKQDTADAFEHDAERFGGSAVLQEIGRLRAGGRQPRIMLVGHSTGAIYICHWLAHASEWLPGDVRFDVVFLAPACTFDQFATVLAHARQRIRGMRIFGMRDHLECEDTLMPRIYPRSLLYFVSGVLESASDEPLMGMERYYSGVPPYGQDGIPAISTVTAFLATQPDSLVWSPRTGVPAASSQATRHGDFDDDVATIESVVRIVTSGFGPRYQSSSLAPTGS
jgi:hypothetical protein